ncbi:hypothetical protein ONZ45_g13972 [Pleurotus djamor]|nr:hypothetical protein ONZ45_g13972 [Pleurotus djamor]
MAITTNDLAQQPDIDYHPDEAKYKARTARRLAENPDLPKQPLPAGYPAKVEGPIVWEGKDWTSEAQWVYQLSPSQLEEIDSALRHFKGLGIAMGYINKETFPLPTLTSIIRGLAEELYSGRGFFVLREIPIDRYSREELAIIYAGLSSHVGTARGKQDDTGAVLAHIKDLTVTHAGAHGNSAYTTDKQVFHSDVGDLIALLAIQTAAEGGTSRISSGGRVYNEIAATRPDLIKVLSDPWPLDRFGGNPPYVNRPVLFFEDGEHPVIQYSRRQFTGYGNQKRNPSIPPITEAQAFLSCQGNLHVHGPLQVDSLTPFYTSFLVITVAQNFITTAMIVLRIRQVDRSSTGCITGVRRKTKLQRVMRIVIESGLLYTATAIISLGTYLSGSFAYNSVTDAELPILVIAFNLIIIRAKSQPSENTEYAFTSVRESAIQIKVPSIQLQSLAVRSGIHVEEETNSSISDPKLSQLHLKSCKDGSFLVEEEKNGGPGELAVPAV